jgi:hypothetical protein
MKVTSKLWAELAPWSRTTYGAVKICYSGGLILISRVPEGIQAATVGESEKKRLASLLNRLGEETGGLRLLSLFGASREEDTQYFWLEYKKADLRYAIMPDYLNLVAEVFPNAKLYGKPGSKFVRILGGPKNKSPYPNNLIAVILPVKDADPEKVKSVFKD